MPTLTKTVKLHPVQHAFCHSAALYRAFVGGRGAGKSFVACYDLIRRARRGRTYLLASPTYPMLFDSEYRTFVGLARELGVLGERKVSPPSVHLTTGADILFRSADDPERLRGPNLSGAVLMEASLMVRDAYDIAIACLREGGEQGWLSSALTPKGRLHWSYAAFGTGQPNTELFRAATRANPFLPAGFHERLAEQYDGVLAQQELDGLFVDMEGAEFPASYFDGPGFWFADWPDLDELAIRVAFLDPSKGADAKTSDFQALVLYGRDRHGTEYVEADLTRLPISAPAAPDGTQLGDGMCEHAVERVRQFRPHGFGVESNQFQLLLKIPLLAEAKRRGIDLPLYLVDNRDNKNLRIRRLGPPLAQRKMRFRNTKGTRLLVEQLRAFPGGDHDDGPDSLEGARRLAIELFNQERS